MNLNGFLHGLFWYPNLRSLCFLSCLLGIYIRWFLALQMYCGHGTADQVLFHLRFVLDRMLKSIFMSVCYL